MRCCGCFRRPKEKESASKDSPKTEEPESPHTPTQLENADSNDEQLAKRSSLHSLKSTNSVYYDCQDPLELPSRSMQSERSDGLEALDEVSERDSSEAGAGSGSGLHKSDSKRSRAVRKLLSKTMKIGDHKGVVEGIGQYEQAKPQGFMVRGKDYMQTKKKVNAQGEVYRLIGCDVYAFDQKISHIAQHMDLPSPPQISNEHQELPKDEQLPPLLVINIQLPTYKASLIPGRGQTDGKTVHIIQYFALPKDFTLSQLDNDAAVGLLQRLIHDGKEANGDRTRDRLKLIARVANVEEWAKAAPLSGYEHTLLRNYNDKPILTRPQQQFYTGENYFEIDLDVHSYAWTARKALSGFLPRLDTVVFEDALIVQGNAPDELPEVVMACARVSHLDFTKARPFPGEVSDKRHSDSSVTVDQPIQASTFPDDEVPTEEPKMVAESQR